MHVFTAKAKDKERTNLPNNHGVLISPLPPLLSEERSHTARTIQAHPPGHLAQLLLLPLGPPPRLPGLPRSLQRGERTRHLPFMGEAGPHPQGPDDTQQAIQNSSTDRPPAFSGRIRLFHLPKRPNLLASFPWNNPCKSLQKLKSCFKSPTFHPSYLDGSSKLQIIYGNITAWTIILTSPITQATGFKLSNHTANHGKKLGCGLRCHRHPSPSPLHFHGCPPPLCPSQMVRIKRR